MVSFAFQKVRGLTATRLTFPVAAVLALAAACLFSTPINAIPSSTVQAFTSATPLRAAQPIELLYMRLFIFWMKVIFLVDDVYLDFVEVSRPMLAVLAQLIQGVALDLGRVLLGNGVDNLEQGGHLLFCMSCMWNYGPNMSAL